VNNVSGPLSALRRLSIAILIAIVFLFGLATTVYLSLRSPEVTVPDVLGKDRFQAEQVLADAGLNFRVRATRPSNELKADTVLFQLPRPGEVVKTGQTVAMDISRSAKEGEASQVVAPPKPEEKTESKTANTNDNTSDNENKPKKNKNTNKNANENANANASNRNANNNRPAANKNVNANINRPTPDNATKPTLIINNNANASGNQNKPERPVTPRPSPR